MRVLLFCMLNKINDFLQNEMVKRGIMEVPVVEAARWLDDEGLLDDDDNFPGRNLRMLCRADRIKGAIDRGRYWVILRKVEGGAFDGFL